ncbi:ribonuclease D [Cryobacterium sp. TMT1-21]|uniref:Ribonuclease D n=1 Tax=Cryobacterium shii TaxID=1259235 RepID=A0AAQ2C899_9MICO|nr:MULTISPECIES: HRDC domain-containing protein [Cryobacterium]TFC51703.1 ribonuclease D [Cryobacterium shii]TFD13670.1 ribonuclease D [Cryobacterium sp. TMT4-10]TFD15967.1 ribonuclease D [Cryobacterium sp. TMT1-21]TFD19815.1 ribonuclease D [Cryobacterium sp. TMT2-23]TFD38306.1 ribonuclease D [Cryobacterium sp. TMT2-10]
MADHTVIDTRDAYLTATAAIRGGTGPIGIDAERASGFTYSQRAYLIQIFRRGAGTFLFDPPAIGDFRELNEALGGEEWIFHAASQDLACLREVGLDPKRIFDTELAARLLGIPRVGLGTVVEELLGIHLAKEHSAANWSTRPLPEAWLVYGALDVELLPDLRDRMTEMLETDLKTDIAAQEFAAVLAREVKAVSPEPWRRLSGVHSIRGQRGLAVARELWLARDRLAQELDISPGRLVPDASLTAAARAMPASKQALADLREFSGRASRSELDRWWGAILEGVASTDLPSLRGNADLLPPPRAWADRNPEADLRYKAARTALTEVSEQLAIPLENLITPDYVRRVAWTPPETIDPESIGEALGRLGARAWQIDVTAQRIADAFVEVHQTIEVPPETDS